MNIEQIETQIETDEQFFYSIVDEHDVQKDMDFFFSGVN